MISRLGLTGEGVGVGVAGVGVGVPGVGVGVLGVAVGVPGVGVGVPGGGTVIFVLESAGFPSSEDNPRPFCKTRSTAC